MDKRVCAILQILLKQDQAITYKEILEILEKEHHISCNIKTIRTSIQQINTFYSMIFGINNAIKVTKKKGAYFVDEIIKEGELQFLFDALTTNTSVSSLDGYELYRKITKLISQKNLKEYQDGQKNNETLTYLNTIFECINNEECIKFNYIDYTFDEGTLKIENRKYGDLDVLTVSPYEVYMDNSRYYLYGYSSFHKECRTFRVDRMRIVRSNGKTQFENKKDEIDVKSNISHSVNNYNSDEEIKLELLCDKNSLRSVVDQFGIDLKVKQTDDPQQLHITIDRVNRSPGLIGWLMMMSTSISVYGPSSLITDMKDNLSKSLAKYK